MALTTLFSVARTIRIAKNDKARAWQRHVFDGNDLVLHNLKAELIRHGYANFANKKRKILT